MPWRSMGEWINRSAFFFTSTSTLVRGERSASHPCRFTPGERATGTHWTGGWVDPRVGLDDMEKLKFLPLPGLELRSLDRRARSQSLCWLRYRGSWLQFRYSLIPRNQVIVVCYLDFQSLKYLMFIMCLMKPEMMEKQWINKALVQSLFKKKMSPEPWDTNPAFLFLV
jgi:hypothetical protein